MALHVSSPAKSLTRTVLPLVENSTDDTFALPAGTKSIDVFRDAGIIYEGADPDMYATTTVGGFLTSVILNTALSTWEILQITAYS